MKYDDYVVLPKPTSLTKKEIQQQISTVLTDVYNGKQCNIQQLKQYLAYAKYKKIDIEKIKINFYYKDDYNVDNFTYSPIKYACYNFFTNEKGFAEVLPYLIFNSNYKTSKLAIEKSVKNMFSSFHGDDITNIYQGAQNFSLEFQQTFNMLKDVGANIDSLGNEIWKLGKSVVSNPKFVEFLINQKNSSINIALANFYYDMNKYKAFYSMLEKHNCNIFSASQAIGKLDGSDKSIPNILYLLEKGVISIKDFNDQTLKNVKNNLHFYTPLEEDSFDKKFNLVKQLYNESQTDNAKYNTKKSFSSNCILESDNAQIEL